MILIVIHKPLRLQDIRTGKDFRDYPDHPDQPLYFINREKRLRVVKVIRLDVHNVLNLFITQTIKHIMPLGISMIF